ncbi:MAG: hypothetical protein JWN59_441 [Sphingomonas bacterium]|nr:hypothetical protein [Sphingomonas bacterium]
MADAIEPETTQRLSAAESGKLTARIPLMSVATGR